MTLQQLAKRIASKFAVQKEPSDPTRWRGYIAHSNRNRRSGATIVAVTAEGQGLDPCGGKYVTLCHTHGNLINHETKALALSHMAVPDAWCDDCHEAYAKRSVV